MSDNVPIEEQVRERACALWERAGRPEGRSAEFWGQALIEIEAQHDEPGKELPANIAAKIESDTVPE